MENLNSNGSGCGTWRNNVHMSKRIHQNIKVTLLPLRTDTPVCFSCKPKPELILTGDSLTGTGILL